MAIGISLDSEFDDNHRDEGSMFGPKPGTWWVASKSDPRFNMDGRDLVGGFRCPSSAREAFEAKVKELGASLPDDLEFGYMKD